MVLKKVSITHQFLKTVFANFCLGKETRQVFRENHLPENLMRNQFKRLIQQRRWFFTAGGFFFDFNMNFSEKVTSYK